MDKLENTFHKQTELKKKLRTVRQSQPLLHQASVSCSETTLALRSFNKQKKTFNINPSSPTTPNITQFWNLVYSPKNNSAFNTSVISTDVKSFSSQKKMELAELFGKSVQNIRPKEQQSRSGMQKTPAQEPNQFQQTQKKKIRIVQLQQMLAHHQKIVAEITNNRQIKKAPSIKRLPRFSEPSIDIPTKIEVKLNKQPLKRSGDAFGYSAKNLHSQISQLEEIISLNKKNLQETMSTEHSHSGKSLRIYDFRVIKELGKGKFGVVSLVMHKKTGSVFAMKAISKNLITDQGITGQVIREVKIQFSINQGNVVKLYAVFDDKNHIYLISQYCFDGQLFKLMQSKKRMEEGYASKVIKDICQGISQLHKHGIIHRDLKPQNIVMAYGIPKICDFGWSVASAHRMRQTFCGTPLYVSPQLLTGKNYNQKVDLWAIGIVTYQMLAGDIPFKISNQKQLVKIVSCQVVYPSFMSDEAQSFISLLLEKDPTKRSSIKEAMKHDFITKHIPKNVSKVLLRTKSPDCQR